MPSRVQRATQTAVRKGSWRARNWLNAHGWAVHRLDPDSYRYTLTSYNADVPLPAGAEDYLRMDNPVLQELVRAYDHLDVPAAVQSLWTTEFVSHEVSLPWFRGDNAYVWQYRMHANAAELRTYLSLLDVEKHDRLGLLDRLREDGLFGAWTFGYGARPPVSRDLLDSIGEINYLEDRIGLSSRDDLSVLDIGAGYGRLAHRMTEAFPDIEAYDCIDGVAYSTFISDYYLRFRGLPDRVRAIRLDEYQKMRERYTVAVNIHSFTECSMAAIRWWMSEVAKRDIEWLLIVPNHATDLVTIEPDGQRLDYRPVVEEAGYRLVDLSPRYADDELRPLIGAPAHFFLFQKRA